MKGEPVEPKPPVTGKATKSSETSKARRIEPVGLHLKRW